MKFIQRIIIIGILPLFLWNCESNRLPSEPSTNSSLQPQKSSSVTAELFLYVHKNDPAVNINIHPLTESWEESLVSWTYRNKLTPSAWTSPGGTFTDISSNIPAFVPDDKYQYLSVDITEIVNAWMSGTPNNGIILEQGNEGTFVVFSSRTGAYPPYVVLSWSDGSTDTLQILNDSYIWENLPMFTGNDQYLYSGLVYNESLDQFLEKRILLFFELPESFECTLTPGYWKTHSKYGPAPYDPVWNDMEDSPFYLSGKSYYNVLWAPPKGNAYFILAHAFIAAELNKLKGADFTDASAAFNSAKNLFENFTPEYVAGLKGKNGSQERKVWIELAEILDNYNNGLIGPGHCDE